MSKVLKSGGIYFGHENNKTILRPIFDFLMCISRLWIEEAGNHPLISKAELTNWANKVDFDIKINSSVFFPPHLYNLLGFENSKKLIAFSDKILNRIPFVKNMGGILIIQGKKRSLILKFNYLNFCILILSIVVLSISVYCLWKFGINTHFQEWTGRGLYPALAFTKGFDLYETQNGPLVTMYGFGMAFFYALTCLASHPSTAINIAYLTNLTGLMVPVYFLFTKLYNDRQYFKLESVSLSLISAILVLFCLQLEKTTSGILNIHADTPALSFILIGLCFFQIYESQKSSKFLVLVSLSVSFAIWSKLLTFQPYSFRLFTCC